MSLIEPSQNSTYSRGPSSTGHHVNQPLDVVLSNFFSLLKRHKLVVLIPVLIAESLALYSYFVRVTYTATSSLIIQKADNSSLQALSIDLGATKSQFFNSSFTKDTYLETILLYLKTRDSFEEAAKNLMESESGKTLYGKLKYANSASNNWLEKVLNFGGSSTGPEPLNQVEDFARMLRASIRYDKAPVPGFVISATTNSPWLSVEVAKTMSEQAQGIVTRRDLKQLEEGKDYILSKMDEITDSVTEIEKEMLNIRQKSSGPITQKGMTETFSTLQNIKSELEQNRIKLDQNERLITSIQKNIRNTNKTSREPFQDFTTQAILRRQLLALRARKQGLLSEGMSERSPQVLSLEEEIAKTEKQLPRHPAAEPKYIQDGSLAFLEDDVNPELRISDLRKENFLLKTKINSAQRLLAAEKASKESLPDAEQKYYALNKRLEMKYLLFGDLSKQLFNIDVSRIAIQNRVLNIEAASRTSIFRKPTLFPIVPMAFILALVFGTLLATIIENFDPTIVSAKNLPGVNYVSLGNVPLIKEAGKAQKSVKDSLLKSLIFRHKLDLPQTVPFKRIRTRLLHLEKGMTHKPKIISIHSTHSGDGKSFITGNLAASIAALNKKVLLIDCDLRKKALSRQLTETGAQGLSTFLGESQLSDYRSLILPNIQPNLDFLPSGPATTSSSELINSQKFHQLLDSVRNEYDFIFLDDAPFMALPDAEIVASHSDIIIAVASCNITKVNDLSTMLDHFLQFGEKPVSVILNRTNNKNQLYYYYSAAEEQKSRARAA